MENEIVLYDDSSLERKIDYIVQEIDNQSRATTAGQMGIQAIMLKVKEYKEWLEKYSGEQHKSINRDAVIKELDSILRECRRLSVHSREE